MRPGADDVLLPDVILKPTGHVLSSDHVRSAGVICINAVGLLPIDVLCGSVGILPVYGVRIRARCPELRFSSRLL